MTMYMVSYGSLLSEFSRKHHSGVYDKVVPASLSGWRRAWCARYADEGTTYAGAFKDPLATISAILIPTQITDGLRQRERHYNFVSVSQSDIYCEEPIAPSKDTFWVCEAREVEYPVVKYPLPQSYVDTCLIGCREINHQFARQFIKETTGWKSSWVNDRKTPIFPRFAQITESQERWIDQLLDECGVLSFRSDQK